MDYRRYKDCGPQGDLENRNPWFGVNAWREFWFDVCHPLKAWRRWKIGARLSIDWVLGR